MKKVTVAIIGYGYWGPNLLRNFFKLSCVDIKYVCDLSPSQLNKAKKNYPSIITTQDLNLVLNDENVSAVIIATPVHTHHDLARKALLRNKHVLVEKPIATSVTEAQDLISIAQEYKLKLMVDHTFVYTAAIRKMKQIIQSGDLGENLYFDSERVNLGLIQNDINVIWDLAPHDISIMNYFFEDEIESVFASGTKHINHNTEELAHISVNYKNGLVGHIHVSWLSPVKIRRIILGGSRKMILMNDVEPSEKIKIYDKGIDIQTSLEKETAFTPIYRGGDITIPYLENSEALFIEAQHFIECIQNNTTPITDGKKGLEVVKILEAADRSIKEKKVIQL